MEQYNGEMITVKVIAEIEKTNEVGEPIGELLEIGSEQTVPKELGEGWIDLGLAELVVPEEKKDEVVPEEEIVPEVSVTRTLDGKEIISESETIINDKEYISVRLTDGTTQVISQAEYDERVITLEK